MAAGAPGPATVELVRLVHGDPAPGGPGYLEESIDWGQPPTAMIYDQPLDCGSYVEIGACTAPALTGSFTISFWCQPTLLTGDWQALVARWAPCEISFGLFCAGSRTLTAAVSWDGRSVEWCTGRAWVVRDKWQFVALAYDADGGFLTLCQAGARGPAVAFADVELDATRKRLSGGGPLHASRASLLFGALASISDDERHWAHFNGKLSRLQIFSRELSVSEIGHLSQEQDFPHSGDVLAAWDLSRDISGSRIVDVSGHRRDGQAVNMPTRGVTGPFWMGTEATMYADKPRLYDAISLHDDDLADAAWRSTLDIDVPATARSGFYATRMRRDGDHLVIPFIVTPADPGGDVCVLVPTFTWQAYSSNRGPWSYTEDGLIDSTPAIYDRHRDGTIVHYVSRRRPTRAHNPSAGFPVWGCHNLTANLYLTEWLEALSVPYSLATDEQLHHRGAGLLLRYRCIIIGSHPEYWTAQMLEGLRAYLFAGGRCLYLAGNGLLWVTSVDPERAYIIEVRKSGDGLDPGGDPPPGELAHSTTLEPGGMWSRRGWPARRLVGVEYAANCFTHPTHPGGRGYRRLSDSFDPRCEFVFEGVDDETIGNFGLNLGSAAAYEMDAALESDGTDIAERLILARAEDDRFIPLPRIPISPRSELVLTSFPGGGAVFAAGSVTWTGSLSHNGHENAVSRITANVLRHFLEIPDGTSVLAT
jgi:N,N-dimethylformamidase